MTELNRLMMVNAIGVLKETGAAALILFVDAIEDWGAWKRFRQKKKLIIVTQKAEVVEDLAPYRKELLSIVLLPKVKLTRLGQIKLSVIMCVTEGIIKGTDTVVCLSGVPAGGVLDMVMVLDLEKECEMFTAMNISRDLLKKVRPGVLEMALNIALELAGEGREGKPVGTTFVIGDHERVSKLSRPLIMNPFKGYPEEARNILDEAVHETIKEFSLLDGAFIIREDGVVVSSGAHLDAALEGEGHLPGLGSRHMAAAGITDVTDAVAVTISGSTGVVRVFMKGKILLELEKPALRSPSGARESGS